MSDTNHFSIRLYELMKHRYISAADIARSLNVSKAAVTKWTKGESIPSSKNIHLLANLLTTTSEYLLTGEISIRIDESLEDEGASDSRVRYGPVFQLINLGELLKMSLPEGTQAKELVLLNDAEKLPLPTEISSGNGFWVKDIGNSNQPKLAPSSLVAINQKPKEYLHGDLVLAIVNGTAVLRVLYKDPDGDYLRPINKEAPFTNVVDYIGQDNCELHGRAVAIMNCSLNFAD